MSANIVLVSAAPISVVFRKDFLFILSTRIFGHFALINVHVVD